MKIAFVLLRTMGDVLLGNTLVNAIKKQYPEGKITFFVNKEYVDIVKSNPSVAEVLSLSSWQAVIRTLAFSGFKRVFVPFQTTWQDNIWHHRPEYKGMHLLDFYAKRCGIFDYERKLLMYPTPEDEVDAPDKCIAIHTTTLVKSKDWSKFQQLVPFLLTRGYRVVQVGLKGDTLVEGVEDYREKFGLNQLYCFFRKCKYFIGLDSGLSYIAASSGCKTIVIQGNTIPQTSGPFGANVTNLVAVTRAECQKQRCHGNCKFKDPCIERITIDKVLAVVEKE